MLKTLYIYVKYYFITVFSYKKLIMLNKISDRGTKDNIVFPFIKKLSSKLLIDCNTTLVIEGIDNIPDAPVLFVCNHQGRFDIPVLISALPKNCGFIAKKEMEKLPVFNRWMSHMRCIFLDRENNRSALKSILAGIENLRQGYSMIIFPEGEKSSCEAMMPFKAGSFKMAVKAKVPIVPITLDGTYKIWEEDNKIKKSTVNLFIHPPIDTCNLSKEDVSNLHITTHKLIEDKLHFYIKKDI